MKKVMMALALAACTSVPAFAAEMTGYVSDDACAAKSAKASKAMDWIKVEACVKKCVKEGSAMVFVTEDNKILRFDQASNAKALPLMGHRVRVTGTAKDGVLKVDTIAAIEMKK
jgi:hypothetical protein